MHSDSQQFVRVAGWFETFTAAKWKTRTGLEVGISSLVLSRSGLGRPACLVQVWLRYGCSEDSCALPRYSVALEPVCCV
jgi:hypothetical protein